MVYRGIVTNGVVILEGESPSDGTRVEVTTLDDSSRASDFANHPAIGLWKDRDDLPEDPVEPSKVLRARLMRRADE